MTLDTLVSTKLSTIHDSREKYAEWQDVDDRADVVEECLLVIDSSLEEREFTDSEADAYWQAMQLPVYSGPSKQLPLRE